MKRIGTIFLTLSFLLAGSPAIAAFSDTAGHQYETAIQFVEAEGIVSGYPDGTYKPDGTINRAEFTKIVVGSAYAESELASCLAPDSFTDVQSGQWFAPYICIAKRDGIVDGYPDGTFKPSNTINFAEAAKIIVNALHVPLQEAEEGDWWFPFVFALTAADAVPDPIPEPGELLTRGEMAEIIYRLLGSDMMEESDEQEEMMEEEFGDPEENVEETTPVSGTYGEYTDGVIGSGNETLLFFWAGWCPYCKANHDRLTNWYASDSFPTSTYKIDYDTADDLKAQYGVTGQDTFIRLDGEGNEIARETFPSEDALRGLLQ